MKNIILSVIGLTALTLTSCEKLPTEPNTTNYSIRPSQTDAQVVISSDAVPISKDFLVNKSEVPLDTILLCFNLTPGQWDDINPLLSEYKIIQTNIKKGLPIALIQDSIRFKVIKDSINPQPTDTNYRTKMNYLNKVYNWMQFRTNLLFSDSLKRCKRVIYYSISKKLNTYQKSMWIKWEYNPKLTCEYIKP